MQKHTLTLPISECSVSTLYQYLQFVQLKQDQILLANLHEKCYLNKCEKTKHMFQNKIQVR